MPTPIKKLSRLAASLAGHGPRNAADDIWLSQALTDYLNGADLATAFNLNLSRGQSDPRNDLKREARDTTLAAAADKLAPGAELCDRARVLHHHLSTYAAGRWRFDRVKKSSPYRSEVIEHHFFQALRLIDHEIGR